MWGAPWNASYLDHADNLGDLQDTNAGRLLGELKRNVLTRVTCEFSKNGIPGCEPC